MSFKSACLKACDFRVGNRVSITAATGRVFKKSFYPFREYEKSLLRELSTIRMLLKHEKSLLRELSVIRMPSAAACPRAGRRAAGEGAGRDGASTNAARSILEKGFTIREGN